MEKTAQIPQGNRMGFEPVPSLLVKMSLPMMISMFIMALYNIVDSIYVSRVSESALTAVSLVYPFQMILSGVAVGTGVGVSSLVARRLGEKRTDEASCAATTGLFLGAVSSLAFSLLFFFLSRPLLSPFTDDPDILKQAVTYLTICGGFCPFSIIETISRKALQGTGRMVYPMIVQSVGAIFNIAVAPVLIFGYLGFPAMGVKGAAIACVSGQALSAVISLCFLFSRANILTIRIRGFRPKKRVVGDIYRVGLPSIIMNTLSSVTNFALNMILISFTATAVSVLGVYFKLQSFVFMPVFGLNSGAMPLMSYNYGARNKKRFMDALKYGSIYAIVIMIIGLALFQIMPGAFFGMFNASEDMYEIGIRALRIISISFPISALSIILSTSFQAIGSGFLSLIVSICRQIVLIVPVAYLLAMYGGLNAIWAAYPIAEAGSFAVCAALFLYAYNRSIRTLGAEPFA